MTGSLRRHGLPLALAMAVGCIASHSAFSTDTQKVTAVEGVTEYRLTNGLRVLLSPDPSLPTVTVNITYLVGSRHESYGETGMAHLLEHLLFKGTPSHADIWAEVSQHGAEGRTNATTNVDFTTYHETFPATEENLKWALDLEASRMIHSFVARKDLNSEMTVVRNEFEMGENNPYGVLEQRLWQAAFAWHGYSRPTIGARSDIEQVPIERLQAFYRTYYQPDNAVLIVVGRFDEKRTLGWIQEKFGSIPKPARERSPLYTEEPAQDGEREVILRRVGGNPLVMAAYHVPPAGHPDAIALNALAGILGDRESGRLRQRLVDTRLATSAGANLYKRYDPGLLIFSTEVASEANPQAVRNELLNVIQSVAQEPPTQAQLDRYRAKATNEFETRMNMGTEMVAARLAVASALGDWRLLFWERDQQQEVTIADLQRVAAQYLTPANRTVVMYLPEQTPQRVRIAPRPDYAAVLKDYQGSWLPVAGERFDPTPDNIEARTERSSLGAIELALLPKKTRGRRVTATLLFHFGNEQDLKGRMPAGQFAGNLLMEGTAQLDKLELSDRLLALHTNLYVRGEATGASVTLQTDGEHLAAALRLAAEVLQQPRFPQSEFETLKRSELAGLQGERAEPARVLGRAMERALAPYARDDVRYVPTLEEEIERAQATTFEDVKKFHRDFYGVGAAQMAFVGDFDPQEVTRLVRELFSDWKSPAEYRRIARIYQPVAPRTETFKTPDKESAAMRTGTALRIRDDDPMYPALALGNYIVGGSSSSRLRDRIRETDGLSYAVGSQLEVQSLDSLGTFSIQAICAPQNEPKVRSAVREVLAFTLKEGFTAHELESAKSALLQELQTKFSGDDPIASTLLGNLLYQRDMRWFSDYERKIDATTLQQVNQAWRRFIDPDKLVTMSAGDFSER